nr:rossmann-fold nad (+)-binding protein [Colletotrichum truncatum]KAF6790078.1 rossmann-fold nad (+)-binding protein [Colletotrichum truncatum]
MAAAHELELKHQKAIHQTQLIAKEEDSRRTKVTKQVLLAENSTLREQLAERDVQISELTGRCDEARAELDSLKTINRDQETQLKAQTREFANIKAELESLNTMSLESTKVLSEKLTLSRELNTLKPELEHLRSQVAHQQTAVAEKLALERQLNMAEVELAAAKRAREQQVAESESNKTAEDELRNKLKDAEKRLIAEKREREQLQQDLESALAAAQTGEDNKNVERELSKKLQEMEKALQGERREKDRLRKESEMAQSEIQAQNEILEQRLDTVKSKLRNTQEELKAVRSELVHARPVPTASADPVVRAGGAKAQNARKRRVEELTINDMSIGTPEEITRGRRAVKKKGLEQTLVGEKSLFSITPFLNKSKTLSVEGAVAEEEEEDEADVSYVPMAHVNAQKAAAEAEADSGSEANAEPEPTATTDEPDKQPVASKETASKTKTKANGEPKKARGRPKKALSEASPNMPTQALTASKPSTKSASPLDKVLEEPEADTEEKMKADTASKKAPTATAATASLGVREQEVKKKKRKLAGESTTLFDDDGEGEAAVAKRPGGKVGLGANKLGKTHLTMARNAFGKKTFSPLKKERRGTQHHDVQRGLSRFSARTKKPALRQPINSIRSMQADMCSAWWSDAVVVFQFQMDAKYRIFRKGQTVVDLGYAPGSWSQVAADRTKPNGQVLGIDIIPAQPPKGVSTIQGNFLSPDVQNMVKDHLVRAKKRRNDESPAPAPSSSEGEESSYEDGTEDVEPSVIEDKPSYIDMERAASDAPPVTEEVAGGAKTKDGRLVDIVLSDMSAPWDQTTGFGVNSLSNPYHRMMNTSGMAFRDHAGSMDLCSAALQFASDTLKNGGHFVCKFYQGSEDKAFEKKLRTLFAKVFREKPESSRSVRAGPPPHDLFVVQLKLTPAAGLQRGIFCGTQEKGKCTTIVL